MQYAQDIIHLVAVKNVRKSHCLKPRGWIARDYLLSFYWDCGFFFKTFLGCVIWASVLSPPFLHPQFWERVPIATICSLLMRTPEPRCLFGREFWRVS